MDTNLRVAAPRLFPSHNFGMVYIEAVANALDAGATNISINIDFNDSKFINFSIIDNGVGFNEYNYNLFSRLMSEKDTAHKGQGRLVYLLYFDNIKFISKFRKDDEIITRKFNFSFDFNKNNYEIFEKKDNNNGTGTSIFFEGFIKSRIKKHHELEANVIRERIFIEFLPPLFNKKQRGQSFNIIIKSNINGRYEERYISNDDIPNFQIDDISIEELKEISQSTRSELDDLYRNPLKLYYSIKSGVSESSVITLFSIDNRAIPLSVINRQNYLHLPNTEIIFFLSSLSFEGLIDPTRQTLTLPNNDLRLLKKILKEKIYTILSNQFPEYKKNIQEEKNKLSNKFPHLTGYIDEHEVGFESSNDLVINAQKQFFLDQQQILEKRELSDEDYEKALELSARNLAEYILFRQIQIEQLKKINGSNKESEIHNIIAPMKSIVSASDNKNIFKHNAWILDDRFMSFIHSTSDVSLQTITQKFNSIFNRESQLNERPDYLMFFSNEINDKCQKVDLVCFEFKRLGIHKYEKSRSLTQLPDYMGELKESCNNIGRIWMYALVDFDEGFQNTLRRQDFKMRFSINGKIWYRYYDDVEAELSFLDFNALINDADSRNKTFMDILKRGFENKFLE